MVKQSPIGRIASKKTKDAFAEELSSYTSFTAGEAKKLFPVKADREELINLIRIVNSDKEDKEKQAELIDSISSVSGAVIKLVKKVTTGL